MKTTRIFAKFIVPCTLLSNLAFAEIRSLDATSSLESSNNQNAYLFESSAAATKQPASDDRLLRSLETDESVAWMRFIDMNVKAVDGSRDTFYINLGPGEVYGVKQSNNYWINGDYQSWSGEINPGSSKKSGKENRSRAVFVRSGERVFGQFNIGQRIFEIMTTENGAHVLVERDMSMLPDGDDTPSEELPTEFMGMEESKNYGALDDINMAAVSTIRVLQVASSTALSRFGTGPVVDRMNFFLAQANDVYANNGLQIRLQDAGKYNSGRAEESSVRANASVLRSPNDGRLDAFAGSIRNSQAADIVALITDNNGDRTCGIVNAIGGGQSNGFFVTRYVCTNFTFVHELGHLFGARHDNDPTRTPFAYGHGFVNASRNFRTVMAVNSNPQPRVGFFSTDDQRFNGGALGNSSFSDNERVHEVRRNTMANFR